MTCYVPSHQLIRSEDGSMSLIDVAFTPLEAKEHEAVRKEEEEALIGDKMKDIENMKALG